MQFRGPQALNDKLLVRRVIGGLAAEEHQFDFSSIGVLRVLMYASRS